MRITAFALLSLTLFLSLGCSSVTPQEQTQYDNLVLWGAEVNEDRKPLVAALSNLLLGSGDLYNEDHGSFVINFLFYPLTIPWAIPQGWVSAQDRNIKQTIAFYSEGNGKGMYDLNKTPTPRDRKENAERLKREDELRRSKFTYN